MKIIERENMQVLEKDALPVMETIRNGYDYDPGSSDLDNEQPIHVLMTLGDYRRASRLYWELRKVIEGERLDRPAPGKEEG